MNKLRKGGIGGIYGQKIIARILIPELKEGFGISLAALRLIMNADYYFAFREKLYRGLNGLCKIIILIEACHHGGLIRRLRRFPVIDTEIDQRKPLKKLLAILHRKLQGSIIPGNDSLVFSAALHARLKIVIKGHFIAEHVIITGIHIQGVKFNAIGIKACLKPLKLGIRAEILRIEGRKEQHPVRNLCRSTDLKAVLRLQLCKYPEDGHSG